MCSIRTLADVSVPIGLLLSTGLCGLLHSARTSSNRHVPGSLKGRATNSGNGIDECVSVFNSSHE